MSSSEELVEKILTTGLCSVVKTLTTCSSAVPPTVTFSLDIGFEKLLSSEASNSTTDDPQHQEFVVSPIPVRGGKLDELSTFGDIKQDDVEKMVTAMEKNLDHSESMSLHLEGSKKMINSTLVGGDSSYEFKMDDLLLADDLVDQSMFSEKEETADEMAFNIEHMRSRAATIVQHINPNNMNSLAGSELGADLIARAAVLRSDRGSMASMVTATATATTTVVTITDEEAVDNSDEGPSLSISVIEPPPIATPMRPRAKSFTSDPMSPSKSFRSDLSSLDAIDEQPQEQRRREDSFDLSDVDKIASVIPFGSPSPTNDQHNVTSNTEVVAAVSVDGKNRKQEVESAVEEKKEDNDQTVVDSELELIATEGAATTAATELDNNNAVGIENEKNDVAFPPIIFDDGRDADCKPFLFLSSLSTVSQQKAVLMLLISLMQQGLTVTVDNHLPKLEEDIETLYVALLEGKRQLQQFAIEQSSLYQPDKKDYGDLPIKYLPTDTRLTPTAQKAWLELLRGQDRLLKGLQTVIYRRAEDLYRSAEEEIKRLVDAVVVDKVIPANKKASSQKKRKGLGLPDLIEGLRNPHKLLGLHLAAEDGHHPNHHVLAPQHNYSPKDIIEERARPRSPLLDTNNSKNGSVNNQNNASKSNTPDKSHGQNKKNNNNNGSNQQSKTDLLRHDNNNPSIPWHENPQRQVDHFSSKLQQSFSSLVSLRATYQDAKALRKNADRMLQRHVEGQLRRMKRIAADLGKEEQAKLEVDGQPLTAIDPVYLQLQEVFPPSPKAKAGNRKKAKTDEEQIAVGAKVLYSLQDVKITGEEEQADLSDMSNDDVDDFKIASPSSPVSPLKGSLPFLLVSNDPKHSPSSSKGHSHNHNSSNPASGKGEMPRFNTLRPATLQLYPFHNPFVDAIHGPVSPYSHHPFTMPEPYEEGTVLMHFADYHPLQQHALKDHKQSLQTVHLRQDNKVIKKIHRLSQGLELPDQHFAHRPHKEEEDKPPSVSEIRTALRRGLSPKHIQTAFGAQFASTASPDNNGMDIDPEEIARRKKKKKKDMIFLHVLAESTHKPSKLALKQETIDLYDFSPQKIRHVVALTPGVMLHPTHGDTANTNKGRPKSASSAAAGVKRQQQGQVDGIAVGGRKKRMIKRNASFFEHDPETKDNDDSYNAAEDFSTGKTNNTDDDLQAILLLGKQQLFSPGGGMKRIHKSNLPPIPLPQPNAAKKREKLQGMSADALDVIAADIKGEEKEKKAKLVSQSTTNLHSTASSADGNSSKATTKMVRPISANNASSESRLLSFLDRPPKEKVGLSLSSSQKSHLSQPLTATAVDAIPLLTTTAVQHHPPTVTENSLLLEVAGDEGPLLWIGDDFDDTNKQRIIAETLDQEQIKDNKKRSKKELILDSDHYEPFHVDKLSFAMSEILSPLGLHPSEPLIEVEDAYNQLQEVIKDENASLSVDFSVQQLSFLFQQLSQTAIQLMKTHVAQRIKKMLTRSSLFTVESGLELIEQFLQQCFDYTRLQEAGVLALPVDITAANFLNPPHSPVKSVTKGRSLKLDIQTLIKFEGEPAIKRLEQRLTITRTTSPPFRYGIPPHDDEHYVRQDVEVFGGGQQGTAQQQQGVPRDKNLTEQQLDYYLINLPRLRRQLLSAVVDQGELVLAHILHPLLFALGMEGRQIAAATATLVSKQQVKEELNVDNDAVKQEADEVRNAEHQLHEKKLHEARLTYLQESSSKLCSEWINELPLLPSDCSVHEFEVNKIEKKLRVLDRWNNKLRSAADDNVHRAKETSQLLL